MGKGFKLPTELKITKDPVTGELKTEAPMKLWGVYYGWTKYVANYENYIFPFAYEYANWDLMIPLFNGQSINLTGAEES